MIELFPWNDTHVDREPWNFGNCCNTHAQAKQARDKRKEVLRTLHEEQRCGPITLRQHHRMLPTVRWKEDWLMQDGNLVPDPVCGRCKKNIDMAVRTEAVYQDKMWFHTACHREGADQLFRATRLSEVLKEIKRGVDIITSPLFQGDDPPRWHAD